MKKIVCNIIYYCAVKCGFAVLFASCSFFYLSPVFASSFDGQVVRAFFTSNLKNNKPVNEVLILENNVRELHFYSEVKNMVGRIISHSWEHRGEKIFEKRFRIVEKDQKLLSSYKLSPGRTGEWMVVISDEKGMPIKAVMFKYVKKGSFAGKGIVPLR